MPLTLRRMLQHGWLQPGEAAQIYQSLDYIDRLTNAYLPDSRNPSASMKLRRCLRCAQCRRVAVGIDDTVSSLVNRSAAIFGQVFDGPNDNARVNSRSLARG